jgi:hypothetical protein
LIEDPARFEEGGRSGVVRRVDRADRVAVQSKGRSPPRRGRSLEFLQQLHAPEMEVRAENRRHDQRCHGRHGERDLGAKRK